MKNSFHTTLTVYFIAIAVFAVGLFLSFLLSLRHEYMAALIPLWSGLFASLGIIFGWMLKIVRD